MTEPEYLYDAGRCRHIRAATPRLTGGRWASLCGHWFKTEEAKRELLLRWNSVADVERKIQHLRALPVCRTCAQRQTGVTGDSDDERGPMAGEALQHLEGGR